MLKILYVKTELTEGGAIVQTTEQVLSHTGTFAMSPSVLPAPLACD